MPEFQTQCYQCGKTYTAQRETSRFCNATCRKRASRRHSQKINVNHEAMTARDALRNLIRANDIKKLYQSDPTTAEELHNLLIEIQAQFINYDPTS